MSVNQILYADLVNIVIIMDTSHSHRKDVWNQYKKNEMMTAVGIVEHQETKILSW